MSKSKLMTAVLQRHYAAHPLMSVLAATLVGFGGTLLLISGIYLWMAPTTEHVATLVLLMVASVLVMVIGAISPLFIAVQHEDRQKHT